MSTSNDDLIRRHYQEQAEKDGSAPSSTMGDQIVRAKEVALIGNFIRQQNDGPSGNGLAVLDVGCGNGYTLSILQRDIPGNRYSGLEFTPDLLAIARQRALEGVDLRGGDIRSAEYPDANFDIVYTERCLINILDYRLQKQAIGEIARILKPGGYYLMVECFTEGLDNNNKARTEMGLTEIAPAYHNLYFDRERLFDDIAGMFRVVDPAEIDPVAGPALLPSNFLSSHYFMARVVHPLLTRGEWIRNTEFVKFFSFLPPVGNYAPIQAYILQKIAPAT